MFKRGEIYELMTDGPEGPKYAVIISAEDRTRDKAQSVIVLEERRFGDRSIPISCQGEKFANCGRVCYTFADRLGDFVRCTTDKEMAQIDAAIAESLGLSMTPAWKVPVETPAASQADENQAAGSAALAAGFTNDELYALEDFINTEFLDSIRQDRNVDNLSYVAAVCNAYGKIKEMLGK